MGYSYDLDWPWSVKYDPHWNSINKSKGNTALWRCCKFKAYIHIAKWTRTALLYEVESWTLIHAAVKRLKALRMWLKCDWKFCERKLLATTKCTMVSVIWYTYCVVRNCKDLQLIETNKFLGQQTRKRRRTTDSTPSKNGLKQQVLSNSVAIQKTSTSRRSECYVVRRSVLIYEKYINLKNCN